MFLIVRGIRKRSASSANKIFLNRNTESLWEKKEVRAYILPASDCMMAFTQRQAILFTVLTGVSIPTKRPLKAS